jgi:hypothetical protein
MMDQSVINLQGIERFYQIPTQNKHMHAIALY